ncbi:MAG: S41 family peptidase [Porphyromonadaceae bacterium]|nr:S41 family peptidase [Porphyromonadaceae bacterium]
MAAAISRLYVDTLNEDSLAEKTIVAMLKQLDPHSTYLSPHEAQQTLETLSGKFEGIGVQINMFDDTLSVVQTTVGGPSEKAGILPGDRIISVDDTLVAGVKYPINDIIALLRGKRGSKVNIGIVRRGVAEPIYFKITRDKIPVNSIDASYMLNDSTGYIKLSRFAETSAEEMKKAVKSLQKEGMKSLILDLQGNGGGYLNVAVDIADMFLGKDCLIVYTEGRNMRRAQEKATASTLLPNERVVVLVDESSASASEILAGALQDWDRAVIIGRRTFGKGLVQRPINLPDKSLLRLTVARYYTPTGRCIQKPYIKGESDEYDQDFSERLAHGELQFADSIHFADSLQYHTLRTGRIVYGGGGIMPDIFVGLDTTLYTPYHRQLLRQGILNRSVFTYLDSHRHEISSKYRKATKFIEQYEIDEHLWAIVDTLASQAGILPEDEAKEMISRPLIATQLKAILARNLYNDPSIYYMIYNPTNSLYLKATEIVASENYPQLLGE